MTSLLERLDSVVALLDEIGADLDAGTFDVAHAKQAVDLFTRVERLAVAGKLAAPGAPVSLTESSGGGRTCI